MPRRRLIAVVAALGVAAILAAVVVAAQRTGMPNVESATGYHAVLLTNGHAYFGKIENLGSSYLLLREVYYVQTRVDPETKATSSILVKRGKEWHAPDRMLLNREHVLFIEPVGAGSAVAKLIEDSKK